VNKGIKRAGAANRPGSEYAVTHRLLGNFFDLF
jgi:hypothetical protein